MRFEIHYPTDDYLCFQKFGECHPSVCSWYKEMGMAGHNGEDIKAYTGQSVRAAHDGVVTFAGEDGSGGYGVVLRTHDEFEYKDGLSYYKSIYWHLKADSIFVRAGQRVKIGQIIAFANNTGKSTGSHLHFGVKPLYQGEEDWVWWNAEQSNGYFGAIDPEPFWSGYHAYKIASLYTQISQIRITLASIINSFNKLKI